MQIFKGKYIDFGAQSTASKEKRLHNNLQFETHSPMHDTLTPEKIEATYPKSAIAHSAYEKIQTLEKERVILYQEILKIKQNTEQEFYEEAKLSTYQKILDKFLYEVEKSLSGAMNLNQSYYQQLEKISTEKDELRTVYHSKVEGIEETLMIHKQKIEKMMQELVNTGKSGFFDIFKDQIGSVIDRITECESFQDNLSQKGIEKQQLVINNRKKAEEGFCRERKKYISMVEDMQKAFDMKWDAKRGEIMREFKQVVDENAKLKEENKYLLEENMFIQDNLESIKKISIKREDELLTEIESMKKKRIKAADDLLQLREKANKVLVEKVNDMQVCINDINFGDVNRKVFDDYTKELELLNERIFILEKKMNKGPWNESKMKMSHEKVFGCLKVLIDKVEVVTNGVGGKGLPHLEKMLEAFTVMYSKQNDFSNCLNQFNGFQEFFNDQYEKFMLKINEQNNIIGKLERQKLLESLEKLKTPRDIAYEMEIKKREEVISQLKMELEVSNGTIGSLMEKVENVGENGQRVSPYVEALMRENAHLQAMKEKAESNIYAVHQNFNDKLTSLASDYQAMANSLEKMDVFIHHSFNVEQANLELSKMASDSLKDIGDLVKASLNMASKGQDKEMLTHFQVGKIKVEAQQIRNVREDFEAVLKELHKSKDNVLPSITSNPVTDLSNIVNNQMQLMSEQPELQLKGINHIYYRVQAITQELEQSKHSQSHENESLAYMRNLIKNTEEEGKRKQGLVHEDMVLLQKKCKETLDLMQKKLDFSDEKFEKSVITTESLKQENEKIQKDSDIIIANTKVTLKDLQELMDNHFKIVANDTKQMDGYKDLNDNLPDIKNLCKVFMDNLEKKIKDDSFFVESLVKNGEGKLKLLQEVDKEAHEMMNQDLMIMRNEVKTYHEAIMKIKAIFDSQCDPVRGFLEESRQLKDTIFKDVIESKKKLSDEVTRYKKLNDLRMKSMHLPTFDHQN